jgi:hypothetical protein
VVICLVKFEFFLQKKGKLQHFVVKFGPEKTLLIRVIRKVRQVQHRNPEFGHTQGEIKKQPAN